MLDTQLPELEAGEQNEASIIQEEMVYDLLYHLDIHKPNLAKQERAHCLETGKHDAHLQGGPRELWTCQSDLSAR